MTIAQEQEVEGLLRAGAVVAAARDGMGAIVTRGAAPSEAA